jgi:hypothetical protein
MVEGRSRRMVVQGWTGAKAKSLGGMTQVIKVASARPSVQSLYEDRLKYTYSQMFCSLMGRDVWVSVYMNRVLDGYDGANKPINA